MVDKEPHALGGYDGPVTSQTIEIAKFRKVKTLVKSLAIIDLGKFCPSRDFNMFLTLFAKI